MVKAIRMMGTGGPEVLRWIEVEPGLPGPGQVLLRQQAAGVNFVDIYQRTGLYPVSPPNALGVEGAGVVMAVGEMVSDLRPGDRVAWAGPPCGGYTEALVIDAHRLLKLPEGLSTEVAGSSLLRAITAQMLLCRVAPRPAGSVVLLHAAAGGLGLLLAQWAQRLGWRVLGTVGSEAKADLAARHGVEVIRPGADFVAEARRLTDGRGVDLVIEGIGGATLVQSLEALCPFGHLASIGQAGGIGAPPLDLSELGPRRSVSLSRPSVFAYCSDPATYRPAARESLDMLADGLAVTIGGRYPLAEAAEAHRALEGRRTTGSVVLIP